MSDDTDRGTSADAVATDAVEQTQPPNVSEFQTGAAGDLQGWISVPRPSEPSPLRMVVVAVHGLGDHSGHFRNLAARLAIQGIAVAAFDQQGHGHSPGKRGRVKSYDSLLEDLHAFRRDVASRVSANQVLIGHSMGGNIVTNYVLRRHEIDPTIQPDLMGAVLVAPMLLPPQKVTRPQIFAAWLTGFIIPWIRVHKKAAVTKLTAEPEHIRRIQNDGLRHSKLSVYLATQLLSQGRAAIDRGREFDVPSLWMVGERDEMIDRDAIDNMTVRIGRSATLVKYPDGRHDLLHDVDQQRIEQRIAVWLDQLPVDSDGVVGAIGPAVSESKTA